MNTFDSGRALAFRPLGLRPSPLVRRGMGQSLPSAAAVRQNMTAPSPVPNWALYAGGAMLVGGGVLSLLRDDKGVFTVALGAAMIGVGGYLFFQTLKG